MDARLLRPLIAVRRRLRLQAALDGAARALVAAATALLVGVYLWRLGLITPHTLLLMAVAAVAAVLAGGALAALRRIPLERVAKQIDRAHELHDRIGSALAFGQEAAPSAFMAAAVADAARHAALVEPKRAAPLSRPKGLGGGALVLVLAGVVALLRFPARAHLEATPPGPPKLAIDADLLEPEHLAVDELRREAERDGDHELAEVAEEMARLLQKLDREELTRKQVFDKLAELENRLKPSNEGSFDELKEKLRKAGVELSRDKLTREAGEALAKEDLDKAKKELEKLAAEAERLAHDEREAMARSLDRAGREQEKSAAERRREQEEKRLREEQRRLQRELAQKPNDQELKRRLERNQRELQRLEHEKQKQAEQKRQLERLQRELQKAAEQLRQKLSPEAAEALRRAAQQMGQMENEIRKLGNMQKVQVQIAELKEVLRRAGQSKGQGGQGGQGGQADGRDSGSKGQKTMLRDFNNRAGNGEKTLILGAGGKNPVLLPLPMGPGDKPGENGSGPPQPDKPGDGIGDQHDPNVMGDPTALAAKRHATRVQGKDAAGPSRSETILGSAERGFASRAYKRVYSDYTSVMEEVMSKERVPPGYRYYVKRYFQLIKPRE